MKPCAENKTRDPITKRCRKAGKPIKTRVPASQSTKQKPKPIKTRVPRPASQSTKQKPTPKTIAITTQQEQLLNKAIKCNSPSSDFWKSKLAEDLMKKAGRTGPTLIQGAVIPITKIIVLTVFFVSGTIIFRRFADHSRKYHTNPEYKIVIDFKHFLRRNDDAEFWKPFFMKYFYKPMFFSIYPPRRPGECPVEFPSDLIDEEKLWMANIGCPVPFKGSSPFSWYQPKAIAKVVLKALGR